jgi:flagellin-like hook-associated protein FlgL
MNRLDLLQVRLEEDEAAYTKLMSQNEDTDLEKAILMKAMAEAAYAAALRASANIIQLSLANFI